MPAAIFMMKANNPMPIIARVWSWKKDSALIELPMSTPTKIVATGARISSAASFSEGVFSFSLGNNQTPKSQ